MAFGGLLLLGLADLGLMNFKLAPDYAEEQGKQSTQETGKAPGPKDSARSEPPKAPATGGSSVAVVATQPAPEPPKTAEPEPPPSATAPAGSTVAAVDTTPPPAATPEPTVVEPPPTPPSPPPAVASGDKPGTIKDVAFEIDSNLLTFAAKDTLDDVVRKLKADSGLKVHIRGHSDQLGSREHNLELSRKRAAAVENFLLANGVPHSRITTEAVGGSKPADASNTPTAWARNRRVELEWR